MRGRRHLEDNFQCHSVRILSCLSLFPLFLCFIISHYGALNIVLQNDGTQVGYKGGGVTTPSLLSSQFSSTTFPFFGGKVVELENDTTQVEYKGGGRRRGCNDPKSSDIPIQQYNFSLFGWKRCESREERCNILLSLSILLPLLCRFLSTKC